MGYFLSFLVFLFKFFLFRKFLTSRQVVCKTSFYLYTFNWVVSWKPNENGWVLNCNFRKSYQKLVLAKILVFCYWANFANFSASESKERETFMSQLTSLQVERLNRLLKSMDYFFFAMWRMNSCQAPGRLWRDINTFTTK